MSELNSHNPKQDEAGATVISPLNRRLRLAERLLAILLTLVAVSLHGVFFARGGGLWRDEVNSVALAMRPTLMDVWSSLKFDSFPMLHLVVVRFWGEMFGAGDVALRALGLTVGLAIIALLWYNARELGNRVPLVSLLLMGITPVMVRSLDSIRPIGIAAMLTILAFTVVWRAVKKPGAVRLLAAGVVLVLCAQTMYHGAILVATIGIAALTVGFKQGGLKQAGLLAVPFCVSAASLVPYAEHLRAAGNWSPVGKNPAGSDSMLPAFIDALNSPTGWFVWVWLAVVVIAIAGAAISYGKERRWEGKRAEDRLLLYCGITLAGSLAGYFMFFILVVGKISYQPWHYIPLLVLSIVSIEPFVDLAMRGQTPRTCLCLAMGVIGSTILFPSARNLTTRMTSMDVVASFVAREARADDLVIVHKWYLGVSFNRYYHGAAPWMTFPGLSEPSVHRYDLLRERMRQPASDEEDLARIRATLQKGGRIWLVGEMQPVNPRTNVSALPPAPLPGTGWSSAPYLDNWSRLLTSTLMLHSISGEAVPVTVDGTINPLESPKLFLIQGWR